LLEPWNVVRRRLDRDRLAPLILIAESLAGANLEPFERFGGRVRYEPELATNRTALLDALGGATALVVRNVVQVDRELLARAPLLRAVGRLGTGLDNIDVGAARERGIVIVDAGDANANAVAEYVFAVILAIERNLAASDRAVRLGRWPRFEVSFGELGGKTLGIAGLGRSGTRAAKLGRAFNMTVLGTRRTPGLPEDLEAHGVERVEPDELFARSHYLVLLLTPLASGRPFIDEAALAAMRGDAILVNAGRGSLVDEAALLRALNAGALRGVVLDTRVNEPPPPGDALTAHPRAFNTPHIAGLTTEAQVRVTATVARGIGMALGLEAGR
jgi:(S)-sulfolactate dehydrogenase